MGIDGDGTQEIIDTEFLARQQGQMYTMFPDVPETLRTIKQKGIKIGLISNIDQQGGRKLCASMKENGILQYFKAIILSFEVGVWKPMKEIFDIALREIGEKNPATAMHVGDSPIEDLRGANNAGLIPVFIDSLDIFSTENIIKIKTLSDILQYL